MKKLLLWLVMVVVMLAVLLGGAGYAMYAMTGDDKLPTQHPTLGDTELEPIGYDWSVPVLGNVLNRTFEQPSTLTVQKLGEMTEAAPELVLPDWAQVDDGMTDMILYLHFNNETGQVKMLQIPRNIFVTTDASFSGNYQINAIAKTQGSNGGNNISALADEIYNIFGLHVDGYLSVRLEALTQIIDTFGGIRVYVPQDMDYGGSHLSQGYQTMDGAAAEFFLRTRHIYADSDLGRLRMQRYFYAALFARMRSMTVWDIAKLLPVITSQMETDLSATELVSVAVSMLKISSSNIMFCQAPVYMGQAISYNGNSTVVVARQETADLLNEYFRENTGPVDASQLNIAGDDGLFDLSGLTASDPSVQFMGTLNEEISDAQQTNNIDGSATTDVYDTATPAPDDSTDGDSTDGDSTPSE